MTSSVQVSDAYLREMFGLDGRVALICGGGRGIGLGIAEALASAGAHVVLADIGDASKAVADIVASGGSASAQHMDVSDEQNVIATVSNLKNEHGRLDILVNAAGIFPNKPLRELDAALWDKVLAVNLKGPYLTTRHAAEVMIAGERGGRIINISSINTARTYIGMAHYDASKAGIEALTRSAALEFAPFGITANAIAPGAVITPGSMGNTETLAQLGGSMEEVVEAFAKKIPQGRWAQPADLGRAVLAIVSPAAGYMTGQTIYVDGGLMLA